MEQPPKKKKKKLPEAAKPFQFKPGQSGNPEGARRHNPITKALKNLTIETYREIIETVCTGNLDALKAMAEDPKISALQVGIAAALVKAIREGDVEVIERLTSRIVGKIPEELNVVSKNLNANVEVDTKRIDVKEEVKAALTALEQDV